MENREEQILSEIRAALSSIRMHFEELESKISELGGIYGLSSDFDDPIDLDFDEEQPAEDDVPSAVPETAAVQEVLPESPADDTAIIDDFPADDFFVDEVPAADFPADGLSADLPADEVYSDLPSDEVPEEDLPAAVQEQPAAVHVTVVTEPVPEPVSAAPKFALNEPIFEKAQSESKLHKAVIDVMAEKQAWRTDLPGTPVKDIRSAISLNDRIIFINLLFGEDPMAFQQTLTRINTLETLGQAVEYITSEFPQWDMDSDLVYRFMMAVRRKVK